MATESDNPPSSNGDVEEERIPILASEVPALLAALESTDNETFERVCPLDRAFFVYANLSTECSETYSGDGATTGLVH